jgi:peptidyl-tRNA hydrolase
VIIGVDMKDHESPEATAARASQEDPIVMYLIVHESLGMGMGKTAAQCAHASQMITLDYFDIKDESRDMQKKIFSCSDETLAALLKAQYADMNRKLSIMGEWLRSSYRKVVLRASDKEWTKIKEEFKDSMAMVVDAGLTEIPSGSETVIALWPVRKSQVSKTIKRLQVLK